MVTMSVEAEAALRDELAAHFNYVARRMGFPMLSAAQMMLAEELAQYLGAKATLDGTNPRDRQRWAKVNSRFTRSREALIEAHPGCTPKWLERWDEFPVDRDHDFTKSRTLLTFLFPEQDDNSDEQESRDVAS
jgi:hypothetical protein